MDTNYSSDMAETGMGTGSSGTTGTTGTTGTRAAGMGGYDDASLGGTSGSQGSRTSLREELSNLKSDLDTLLTRAASLTDREFSDARDKLMAKFGTARSSAKGMYSQAGEQLGRVRESAKDMYSQAGEQVHRGVDATNEYVRENPVQSIAIAAGVGLALGMLLSGGSERRSRRNYR